MQALTNATTATTNSTIELILSAVPALVMPLHQRCLVELVSCRAKQAAAAEEEVGRQCTAFRRAVLAMC
jgi:hypothetical protein